MYENYLEDKENHFNYFNDLSNVKIELLECYKSKNIPRISINEIKSIFLQEIAVRYFLNLLNMFAP